MFMKPLFNIQYYVKCSNSPRNANKINPLMKIKQTVLTEVIIFDTFFIF